MQPTRTLILVALASLGSPAASAQPPSESPPAEAPPVEAPPVEAPPADDIDLAALGLDPAAAFDDRINIYGFADFNYQRAYFGPRSLAPDSSNFLVGNLNVYLAKNLTPRWRSLVEVRFLFSPNGAYAADGSYVSTTTPDPANQHRPIEWGGIRIERAYLEYDLHTKLTVRAGRFLSPYGIWNIDHGSPAIISTIRPYVIGEAFIPEAQTGIHLFGATHVGEYRIGYHATVSNGRASAEATSDPDAQFAYGGRIEVSAPWAGTLNAGVSAYAGRATRLGAHALSPSVVFDEATLAADLMWARGRFLAQGEGLGRRRDYLTGHRRARGTGFQPDGHDVGAYVLAGYRFNRAWNVMPYVVGELYEPLEHALFERVRGVSFGLNFRPTPTVVLKAATTIAETEGAGLYGELGRFTLLTTQAAWVF